MNTLKQLLKQVQDFFTREPAPPQAIHQTISKPKAKK